MERLMIIIIIISCMWNCSVTEPVNFPCREGMYDKVISYEPAGAGRPGSHLLLVLLVQWAVSLLGALCLSVPWPFVREDAVSWSCRVVPFGPRGTRTTEHASHVLHVPYVPIGS